MIKTNRISVFYLKTYLRKNHLCRIFCFCFCLKSDKPQKIPRQIGDLNIKRCFQKKQNTEPEYYNGKDF